MKIEITTGQYVEVDNIPAIITSIHPEAPSLYTTITFEFTEGPYQNTPKTIRLRNN